MVSTSLTHLFLRPQSRWRASGWYATLTACEIFCGQNSGPAFHRLDLNEIVRKAEKILDRRCVSRKKRWPPRARLLLKGDNIYPYYIQAVERTSTAYKSSRSSGKGSATWLSMASPACQLRVSQT